MGRVASIVADVQAGFVLTTAKLEAELKAAVDDLADGNSLQWCAVDAITPDGAAEWVAPDVDAEHNRLCAVHLGFNEFAEGRCGDAP